MNEEKIEEKVEKLLNCKETTRIFGYSERGILNSLMFEISKDKKLMIEFLKLILKKYRKESELQFVLKSFLIILYLVLAVQT